MPKIDIPEECIPEGAEIVQGRPVEKTGVYWGGKDNSYMTISVPIGRKQVLTAVVFEVAGSPRRIGPGEWYLHKDIGGCVKNTTTYDTAFDHVPVNHREIFSCQ